MLQDIRSIVRNMFSEPQKCYGHCDRQSKLELFDSPDMLRGFYVCPSGYVSRVIGYSSELDLESFKRFVSSMLGGKVPLRDSDIRIATRYSWDLGLKGYDSKVLRAAFWTQNYRGSKIDDPNRSALFLCSSCKSPYVQPASSANTLCEKCRVR